MKGEYQTERKILFIFDISTFFDTFIHFFFLFHRLTVIFLLFFYCASVLFVCNTVIGKYTYIDILENWKRNKIFEGFKSVRSKPFQEQNPPFYWNDMAF